MLKVQICMHRAMSASEGEAVQYKEGVTNSDVRPRQSLQLQGVDSYKTLGPLKAQLRK